MAATPSESSNSSGQRLPDFLYIGASKSGSTWMYQVLQEHPQVFVPEAKDLMFFDREYHRGLDWYCSFFADAPEDAVCGELSHDTFLFPECADRVAADLPEAKLFFCLREPVSRMISRYLYARSTHLPSRVTLAEYAASEPMQREASYLRNLQPFYERTPRERISCLFYDDLKADAAAFASRLYAFIGVDPSFAPPSLSTVILPARQARSTLLAHLAYHTGRTLRSLGGANFIGKVKHSPRFEKLLYKPVAKKPEIPLATRQALWEQFSAEYDALEALLEAPLPAAWRKPPQ